MQSDDCQQGIREYVDREGRFPIETSCMMRPKPSRTIRNPAENTLLISKKEAKWIYLRKVGD